MKSTILIVDDEEAIRKLLSRLISLEGFDVLQASGITSAKKILQQKEIDIILCDVKLPDGNGVDFVAELKTKYPLSEVILLTAYGNIPDGVQAIKNGAFDYILKGDDNDKIIPLLLIKKLTLAPLRFLLIGPGLAFVCLVERNTGCDEMTVPALSGIPVKHRLNNRSI